MILVLRTDSPKTYVALYKDGDEVAVKEWEAGRSLSDYLLQVIQDLCASKEVSMQDLQGVIVYEGPGSYTGLRIGISVANAIGYASNIPVVGVTGDDWISAGQSKLSEQQSFSPVTPQYGGDPHITQQKK